ncbi:hypothetical protein [Acrocarpospora catenulata]|uniref:hypothetical protein n=1 Tax=Acrocarpospora catenulata TaxID=2836182 RepID=UPI001BDAFBEC|nr:hypothetical protein [Acrocarpospora catenulata]
MADQNQGQGQAVGTFAAKVATFEQAEPIRSHDAFRDYLDLAESMFTTAAMMGHQDAEIAATWLSRRKPKKGKRVPWIERTRLARRTRGHGRHLSDQLHLAINALRAMRAVHAEFEAKEKKARGPK